MFPFWGTGEEFLPQATPATVPNILTEAHRQSHGSGYNYLLHRHGLPDLVCSVAHNVILSHALAVQLYRNEFKPSQRGVIGITLNGDMAIPYDDSPESKHRVFRVISDSRSTMKQTFLLLSTL